MTQGGRSAQKKTGGVIMRLVSNLFPFGLVLILAGSTAMAHHSRAPFDIEAEVTFDGVITKYEWASPHIYIFVETETDAGDTVVWVLQTGPPAFMTRLGWSRDTFAAGEFVTVNGHPARKPNRKLASVISIEKADGTVLRVGWDEFQEAISDAASTGTANSLSGTWVTLPGPSIEENREVTDKGAAAIEHFREETMLPGAKCIPSAAPDLMLLTDTKMIEVGDETIAIGDEYWSAERTIHMSVNSHDGVTPTVQGHSIGRWEGNVLVVNTAHFADHRIGNGWQLPSGSQKRLVERFELSPDGTSLTYRFELEDSEYLAVPITGERQWVYRPDLEYAPEECDLENARRYLGE